MYCGWFGREKSILYLHKASVLRWPAGVGTGGQKVKEGNGCFTWKRSKHHIRRPPPSNLHLPLQCLVLLWRFVWTFDVLSSATQPLFLYDAMLGTLWTNFMKMDQECPTRSTCVTLGIVLASEECARDCPNSADKFCLMYSVCDFMVWTISCTSQEGRH